VSLEPRLAKLTDSLRLTIQEERSNYGTLQFPGDRDAPSPFLVCSDRTSPDLLATFLAHGPWALERPDLLVVIAGGAQNFTLHPPRLVRALARLGPSTGRFVRSALLCSALASAAASANLLRS